MKLIPITPAGGDLFDLAAIARAITGTLTQAAQDAQQDLQKTTATWRHKVDFAIAPIPDGFQVGTDDEIWGYVDEGTPAHDIPPIVPKRKKAITIRPGGSPKTRVRVIGSGGGSPGAVVAVVKRAKTIHHPGTEAREFSETVQEKFDVELPRRMDAALDGALKR